MTCQMGLIEARKTRLYMASTHHPVSRVLRGVRGVTFSHWSLKIVTERQGGALCLAQHRHFRLVLRPIPVQCVLSPRLYVPWPCVLPAIGVRPRRMLELFRRFGVVNGNFPLLLLHRILLVHHSALKWKLHHKPKRRNSPITRLVWAAKAKLRNRLSSLSSFLRYQNVNVNIFMGHFISCNGDGQVS